MNDRLIIIDNFGYYRCSIIAYEYPQFLTDWHLILHTYYLGFRTDVRVVTNTGQLLYIKTMCMVGLSYRIKNNRSIRRFKKYLDNSLNNQLF